MLEYRALGGLSVVDGGRELSLGGARQRRLAAVLLIDRNHVLSVDRLAEVVFAGEPTPAATTTLRSYVARLRRVVERPGSESRVVTRPPGYVLEIGDEAFDVARFEGSVATGRGCLARGDAATASRVLCDGLALWRGGAYAEFADEAWAAPEAQRLGELRLVAHELLADAELARGRAAEVASALEALAAEHPLREAFQAKLMLALYRSGRQVEALRVYQAHREVLAGELGLDPPPELAELEGRILIHDEALRDLEPDELRLRGYRLGERLGTGRDGTVYAARLPGVDRDIAIRVVPEAAANAPGFVRSFDAVVRRWASLRHMAVVPVHDWWREPGAAYVVMRRMRGGTLRDRLQRGRVATAEVAALVARVGAAVAAAARAGIVHRRVVAESILFDEGGDAYLDLSLGTGDARVPGEDVRDLAAVVAESLNGERPTGTAVGDVPAPVVEVLTAALAGGEPLRLEAFVSVVVAGLSAGVEELVHEGPNPYKGLRAFDETDAKDFFGRDALVDEVVDRLAGEGRRGRLVLVVGASGSGKSSLVQAGLLPKVRAGAAGGSERWFVTTMVPGASPFEELAESLRRVAVVESPRPAEELGAGEDGIDRVLRRVVPENGELLLVVDQLEELFTLAADGQQRAFLDGLTYAVSAADSRLRVVATLRADFYDRPLRFERFAAAVGEATVLMASMSAAELEATIVGPVERVGGQVEPALAAELVGAVLHEPAALPSLQYTLYVLAERSPDRNLTLAGYHELGGVDAAIAARAEELHQSLDGQVGDGVRRLFERLVVVRDEGEPTRRRALRSELTAAAGPSAAGVLAMIDVWARARLLTLDRHPETREPTVEVAHEALLRQWPRLRGWLEDDRDEIVALAHLREAAASWAELDHDAGALYRGARLETALRLTDGRAGGLPVLEREFLQASRAEWDRERQREVEQLESTARANRRLRAQLLALAIALVVALVVGVVAVRQRDRADDERRLATAERRVATARELAAAANANVDVDAERSILLSLAAIHQTRSADGSVLPEAEEALHRAVTRSLIELRVPGVGGSLDWSPGGTVFVTEGPEDTGTVDLRDTRTGESVRSWHGHDADVNDVAFNHDGTMLATTGDDGAARIWDPGSGRELRAVEGSTGEVWGPSFSDDGSLFAAAWPDEGVVRVVDVASGRVVRAVRAVPAPRDTSFDPQGARVAVASLEEPVAAVVDIASGEKVFDLEGHRSGVWDVDWSPDGASVATASNDSGARLYDATTGRLRFALWGHSFVVTEVDWAPSSDALVTASRDGTAKLWTLSEGGGRDLMTLSAHDTRTGIDGVAFSPDGSHVLTGSADIAATQVWDVGRDGHAEIANLVMTTPGLPAATYTPDGRYLLSTGPNGSITVWDVRSFAYVRSLGAAARSGTPGWATTNSVPPAASQADAGFISVSHDSRLVAASGPSGVRVWDLESGRQAFAVPLRPRPGFLPAVDWSPTDDLLAVTGREAITGGRERGLVTIVDRAGQPVTVLREQPDVEAGLPAFSPDGDRLVTTRLSLARPYDPTVAQVAIWDWRRGTIQRTIGQGLGRAFPSPDGDLIAAIVGTGDAVEVWDAATRARVATLSGHTGTVRAVAFSPDGSRVASTGDDGTVRLWDPRTGEQLLVLRGHIAVVAGVAFSPDGSQLVSAGGEGIARVWALDLDDLIEIAESELTRTFTDAECRQYLHTERCP